MDTFPTRGTEDQQQWLAKLKEERAYRLKQMKVWGDPVAADRQSLDEFDEKIAKLEAEINSGASGAVARSAEQDLSEAETQDLSEAETEDPEEGWSGKWNAGERPNWYVSTHKDIKAMKASGSNVTEELKRSGWTDDDVDNYNRILDSVKITNRLSAEDLEKFRKYNAGITKVVDRFKADKLIKEFGGPKSA